MGAAYQTGESSYQQMKGQGEIVQPGANLAGCQPIGDESTLGSLLLGGGAGMTRRAGVNRLSVCLTRHTRPTASTRSSLLAAWDGTDTPARAHATAATGRFLPSCPARSAEAWGRSAPRSEGAEVGDRVSDSPPQQALARASRRRGMEIALQRGGHHGHGARQ
jgi:hypothetical protein